MQSSSQDELTESCLLDGLTLQGAGDALSPCGRQVDRALIPYRISSLALLVEALVCNERIVTLPVHSPRWLSVGPLAEVADTPLLRILELPDAMLDSLHAYSVERFLRYDASNSFGFFVRHLADHPTEGALLRIARNYRQIESPTYDYFRHHDAVPATLDEDAFFGTRRWPSYDEGRSALRHAAAVFGTGAFFYRAAAGILGTPYLPNVVRAPFCILDDAQSGHLPVSGARLALQLILDEARKSWQIAAPEALPIFLQAQVPPIFLHVLSECADQDDVIPCALRVRHTRTATRFRAEMGHLSRAVNGGDLARAVTIVDRIRREARHFLPVTRDTREGRLTLTLGFSVAKVAVDLPITLSLHVHRRHRATIYRLLLSELPTLHRLQRELGRVFGPEVALAVMDGLHTP